MARIGDYIQAGLNTYDPSPYLNAQARATSSIGSSIAGGIGAVGDAIEDRKVKKDTIKTSKELAKAMAVLYPESAQALEPVIAQLDDEETPLSQRAALGSQIGEFINMGAQKSRDNALMNLERQRIGLDERRVAIAEAMPQAEAAAAQSQALSENALALDQAISLDSATVESAALAGVEVPKGTRDLLAKYLSEENGPAALAAAEAQAKSLEKFIGPDAGPKLTKIGATDASGRPVDMDVFIEGRSIYDLQGNPLNQVAPVDGTVLPLRDDVPAEEAPAQRRIQPMPQTQLGVKPSSTALRTPTQEAIDQARLKQIEGEVATQQTNISKEQATKQASLANAKDAVALIDRLKEHPGFSSAVGTTLVPGFVPATDRKGAEAIIEQLKGQAFLNAIQQLRGLGALSDAEGAKLQQAAARLNADQSEEDFKQALDEYRSIVTQGIERLQGQSGTTAPAAPAASATDRLKAAKAALGQ